MKLNWLLLALGLALEGVFVYLGYGLSTSTDDILPFVFSSLAAFLLYALALWLLFRLRGDRWTFRLIFVLGLVFRATLVPVGGEANLPDDDIYRYLWDGRVTAVGLNPYRYSPQDVYNFKLGPDLSRYSRDDLRYLKRLHDLSEEAPFDRIFPEINYPGVKTIYPPASQYVFAIGAWIRPGSFVCLKAIFFAMELLTMFLIAGVLRALGRDPRRLAVYAWCPLVIEEFSYSGHHDVVAVFFLALSFYLLARRRNVLSGLAMGLAILAKVFPVLLLPVLLRRAGWRSVVAAGAVVVLLALPFLGAGWGMLSGLGVYAQVWQFNTGLFTLIREAAALVTAHDLLVAKGIAGLAVAAVSFFFLLRKSPDACDALKKMLIVLTVLLLVSPVLDPWYVTWIVPLLCMFPFRPLILLSGCVFLHYFYFLQFRDQWWIRPVEFGIFWLALAVEGMRYWYVRRRGGVPPISSIM